MTSIPSEFRRLVSNGKFHKPTTGICPGFKQANMVMVPKQHASFFERVIKDNYGPMPLLEYSENCNDIIHEIPRYAIHIVGKTTQTDKLDRKKLRIDDGYVYFLLGCSFSFEGYLLERNIPVRNIEQNTNVTMYDTNIVLDSPVKANMVVSMRPIPKSDLKMTFNLSSILKDCHAAPIGIGSAWARENLVQKDDFSSCDYGETVRFHQGDVPVFWCCGVTGYVQI